MPLCRGNVAFAKKIKGESKTSFQEIAPRYVSPSHVFACAFIKGRTFSRSVKQWPQGPGKVTLVTPLFKNENDRFIVQFTSLNSERPKANLAWKFFPRNIFGWLLPNLS